MRYGRTLMKWYPWPPIYACEVYLLLSSLPIESASVLVISNSETFVSQQAKVLHTAYPQARIVFGTFRQGEDPLQPERLKPLETRGRI